MPSLNTLRTKGGVVVTIIIFLALLAFVLGDVGKLFNPNKLKVGEINGKNIDYSEFLSESNYMGEIYKMMRGTSSISTAEQDEIYNNTWSEFMMKYAYKPGFEKLGLSAGKAEQVDMLNGVNISPVITSIFANPATGMYDSEMMKSFLQNVGPNNPGSEAIWNYLKSQMYNERITSKYNALVGGGMFVTDLEVENSMAVSNNRYNARVVSKNYSSIADSLVNVSAAQIKDYYTKHKETFKRTESRDVEYVVFDIEPSQDDFAAAKQEIERLAEEFGTSDAPMQYASLNSQVRPDVRFYKESELTPELAAIAFGAQVGEISGPSLVGNTYTVSRLAETKMMPDSLGAKHILLKTGETALADSLVRVIRRGSDFATLAFEYSEDQSVSANGGDLGRFNPDQMVAEFSNALLNHRVGDIFTVESSFGLHIVELTYRSPEVRKAQIATITYMVDPSDATMQSAYQRANNMVTASNGNTAGFREIASQEGLSRRSATVSNTQRNISGFTNSKEFVHWAFSGKEGEVSNIMELDDSYVVAAITKINKAGYPTVEDATDQIRPILIREAKGKMLAEQMAGTSLDAVASSAGEQIVDANNIDPNSLYVMPIGSEPKFIGAVTALQAGQLSKPVTGNTGVYVFEISDITSADASITAEDEKLKLESASKYRLMERTFQALTEESGVEDIRVKYF